MSRPTLYDANNRPIKAAHPGLEGASTAGRRVAGWNPPVQTINSAVISGGDLLRSRARQTARNSHWGTSFESGLVSNVIGTGIVPAPKHPDKAVKKMLRDLWLEWTDNSDADGRNDFYGQQALLFKSVIQGGEALSRIRYRRMGDGWKIPLKIQLLEAEHLPNSLNKVNQGDYGVVSYIKQGIEFNRMNERTAYHLYRDHPGDMNKVFPTNETVPIPASSIQHVYEMACPGQVRGISWYAPILVKLWELSTYDNSELARKNLTTMLVGWIKRNGNSEEQAGIRATSEVPENVSGVEEQAGVAFSNIEPGTILDVGLDAELDFYAPSDVGQMYPEFMRVQLMSLAAGMRVPYYVLTGDLTSVSFSSIRAGLIEFRRKCQMIQHQLIVYQFCRPVWDAFIRTCAMAGLIDANELAMFPDRYGAAWKPQKGEWVDPVKDIEAEIMAIRAGLKSRAASVDEMGEDAEEIDEQQAADNERADSMGLKYDSDGRNPKNGAAPQQPETARQDKQLATHLL